MQQKGAKPDKIRLRNQFKEGALEQYTKRERFSNREFERIEKLIKLGETICMIATLLDRDKSNVSRHINNPNNIDEFVVRRKWIKRFSAAKAIENQEEKKRGRGRIPKVAKDKMLRQFLEEVIKKKKWSPKTALGYAKKKGIIFEESISVKTIYNSIYRGDITVNLFDLWLKLRRNPSKEKVIREWKRILGKKISERPDISNREEFGHWEIDTMFWGKGFSILVIVERKTRLCKIIKLKEHTSKEVNEKLESLKLPIKTLTADNGMEFSKLIEIYEETFFTHPYSSWEKGSVENLNGLIRRYLPRTTNPDRITESILREIENEINNLPREILDYSTARELYEKEMLAA